MVARFVLCALAAGPVLALAPVGASAQTGVATREAYDSAMQCFVANMTAAGQRREKGDTEKGALYEANARRSFDGAVNLGKALGLSGAAVRHDFDDALAQDMPKMVHDQDYFVQTVATCRGLGLM